MNADAEARLLHPVDRPRLSGARGLVIGVAGGLIAWGAIAALLYRFL